MFGSAWGEVFAVGRSPVPHRLTTPSQNYHHKLRPKHRPLCRVFLLSCSERTCKISLDPSVKGVEISTVKTHKQHNVSRSSKFLCDCRKSRLLDIKANSLFTCSSLNGQSEQKATYCYALARLRPTGYYLAMKAFG